jgi:hypothetical protein
MMKEYGIRKVYYSTEDGKIETMKVNDMIPEHISHGTIISMRMMTPLNQYLVFGMTINMNNINRQDKKIIYDTG